MGIPKDQKPAERFRATPQRRITREMFLNRSFTVKPLEERPLLKEFDRLFKTRPVFQPLPLLMPKAKPWTLAATMPERMPLQKQSFEERHPNHPVHHAPSHTSRLFEPDGLRRMAGVVVTICKDEGIEALLVCGISGLTLAGAVSALGGIRVIAARKPSENPVAGSQGLRVCGIAPEGPFKRWAWLDDHIGSGGTFQRSRSLAKEAKLIATTIPSLIILYEGSGKYMMTEQEFVGLRLSWEYDPPPAGVSVVESVRI